MSDTDRLQRRRSLLTRLGRGLKVLLTWLGRGLGVLLAIGLSIAIVVALIVLVRQVAGRVQRSIRNAGRLEIMAVTATAMAEQPGTEAEGDALRWGQPAGQIVLAVQQPNPTPTLPPVSAPTLPPTATLPPVSAPTLPPTAGAGVTATPAPPTSTLPPTVIYAEPEATQPRPTVAGLYEDYDPPAAPPPTAIPTRMPMADNRGEDIINVLLLGVDTHQDRTGYRSDSIIVVSINRTTATVNMLSIPRDLYVYIPGWTMQRINTAITYGDSVGWRGGGVGLLRDTLLYNLGIPIHFYARVDFEGFKKVIDLVGGVDVPVDCEYQYWIPKEAGVDESDEANWELFTMPVGVQHLDGHHALWYARARKHTSDFDRSRRQQMILRALFDKAKSLGLLTQVPVLWEQVSPHIATDMTLVDILGLVPTALQLDSSRIQSLVFTTGYYITDWTTPDGDRVLVPVPGNIEQKIWELYTPPTQNNLVQEAARIEVFNGTANPDWDEVAVARLAWEGFVPVAAGQVDEFIPDTIIYDYTGQTKGSSLGEIVEVLKIHPNNIIVEPNPDRTVDYRVILGASYNSCTYNVPAPRATPTPSGE